MAEVKTNEGTKFTEEEMKQVNEIKQQYNESTIRLGQVAMDRLLLEEEEKKLAAEHKAIRDKEMALAKSLSDKYGKGNLDLETGIFVPIK
jgi:Na+/phosphate symporter